MGIRDKQIIERFEGRELDELSPREQSLLIHAKESQRMDDDADQLDRDWRAGKL